LHIGCQESILKFSPVGCEIKRASGISPTLVVDRLERVVAKRFSREFPLSDFELEDRLPLGLRVDLCNLFTATQMCPEVLRGGISDPEYNAGSNV
jgi:hypothetical protein